MGVMILVVRRHVPESPRWMMIHGRNDDAEQLVSEIEADVAERTGETLSDPGPDDELEIQQRESTGFIEIGRTLFAEYRSRSVLGFTLLATQAFLYNAVIFTFSLVLTNVFDVDSSVAGLYLIPFGIANFLGALALGRLFDTVGRRVMISGTYLTAAAILAVLAALLAGDGLGTWGYMGLLCGAFFFASAAASAGYLTVSETFPLEIRAMAIALFYAISTGIGGAVGPLLFGRLLGGDDPTGVAVGYWIAAGLMALAALVDLPRRRRRAAAAGGDRGAAVGRVLGGGGDRARAAGEQVGDQHVDALLEPAAAREQVLGERADVAQRVRGLVEAGGEDQGVGGVADASLLARQELRRPQLGECLYNAPVGLCAFVGHDTWSPGRSLRHKETLLKPLIGENTQNSTSVRWPSGRWRSSR